MLGKADFSAAYAVIFALVLFRAEKVAAGSAVKMLLCSSFAPQAFQAQMPQSKPNSEAKSAGAAAEMKLLRTIPP